MEWYYPSGSLLPETRLSQTEFMITVTLPVNETRTGEPGAELEMTELFDSDLVTQTDCKEFVRKFKKKLQS